MKTEIHPNYNELVATCSCGNVITVGSTRAESIYLDVCSACHPFYTGKQKVADTGGRIDRFNKRFGASKKEAAPEVAVEAAPEVLVEAAPEVLVEAAPEVLVEAAPEPTETPDAS